MPLIEPVEQNKILAGRKAVDDYRASHSMLYIGGYYKGVSEDHTPLLNVMLEEFKKQGFNSIQEFFDASELLNIQGIGFTSKEDFGAKATLADRGTLYGMWQ